jgi:hypothetical protein
MEICMNLYAFIKGIAVIGFFIVLNHAIEMALWQKFGSALGIVF